LLGVIVQDGVATVDLGSTFGDIRAPDQVLATAQVVMTAASFPGVDSVQISLDGKAAQMPLADGTLSWSPLTFADYASLLAGASPAS
jgi:spore germination protein GerM